MNLFISWRSASYVDLDGESCIVVKQVFNWLCIAVLCVIHISHRLGTILLSMLKYELYRFRTGLCKDLMLFITGLYTGTTKNIEHEGLSL